MCSNIGTPKIINFPFGTNGKLMVLGVPILKHFRVGVVNRPSVFESLKFYRILPKLNEFPQSLEIATSIVLWPRATRGVEIDGCFALVAGG